MLWKIVFFVLPVVLSATKFCTEENCKSSQPLFRNNARIVNGVSTERHSRPFQVALYLRVGTTGEVGFCGGSLVHPRWVLTAAHCCFHDAAQVDNVQAILGAHSLYDRYENGRRIVNVDGVVVHPDWEPETFTNDLALLHLANTVQLTDTIDVVRLPPSRLLNSNFAGVRAITSGWGIPAEGVPFISPSLREYNMTVITDQQCNGTYQSQLPMNTVCGFSTNAGTCKGDNGGPLTTYLNGEDDTIILIGVSSFVSNTGCNTDIPSVFTRIQRYMDWISEITGLAIN